MQGTVNLLESRFGLNWSLLQPDTIGTWLQQQTNVLDASWCYVKLLYIGWGQGLGMNPSFNHCMFRAFSALQLGVCPGRRSTTITLTSNAAAASILRHLVCPLSPQMQHHKGQPCHSEGSSPVLYMRSPWHCSPCCWMGQCFQCDLRKSEPCSVEWTLHVVGTIRGCHLLPWMESNQLIFEVQKGCSTKWSTRNWQTMRNMNNFANDSRS